MKYLTNLKHLFIKGNEVNEHDLKNLEEILPFCEIHK